MCFKIFAATLSIILVGCAGRVDYLPPVKFKASSNMKIVNTPRSDVWNSAVPELGKKFFVINNLDKSSGLINISYTGDPERYIDCGRITSFVENMAGARSYDFAAAKAQQTFEVMENALWNIDRKMNLEGRVNLIFEEISPASTRVSANTKYVVTRSTTSRMRGKNISNTSNDIISFNSGSSASFPVASDGRATECVPTGELEQEILAAIK